MAEIDDELSAEEARQKIGGGEARALDMRDQDEMAEGSIPGAMWVDEELLEEKVAYIQRGNEDMPVVLFCANGSKSSDAAEKLREDGYEVVSLKGGYKAWKRAGLPENPRPDSEYDGPKLQQPGTGGGMGGDESSEEKKIAKAEEYREGADDEEAAVSEDPNWDGLMRTDDGERVDTRPEAIKSDSDSEDGDEGGESGSASAQAGSGASGGDGSESASASASDQGGSEDHSEDTAEAEGSDSEQAEAGSEEEGEQEDSTSEASEDEGGDHRDAAEMEEEMAKAAEESDGRDPEWDGKLRDEDGELIDTRGEGEKAADERRENEQEEGVSEASSEGG